MKTLYERENLKRGDYYYWITPIGKIEKDCHDLANHTAIGYKTKEDAEKARDIAFAKQRVKVAIEVANKGWEPDWENDDDKKYCFRMYQNEIGIIYWYNSKEQPNWIYCKTMKVAKQILAEHRDDLELIFSE